MNRIDKELARDLDTLRRTGGKQARKKKAAQIRNIVHDICENEPRITSINQIGRNHISGYINRKQYLRPSTKSDHNYAIKYFWSTILSRNSCPPTFKL